MEVTELAGSGLLGGAKESRASLGSLRSRGAPQRSCWEGPLTRTSQEPSEKEVLFNDIVSGGETLGPWSSASLLPSGCLALFVLLAYFFSLFLWANCSH